MITNTREEKIKLWFGNVLTPSASKFKDAFGLLQSIKQLVIEHSSSTPIHILLDDEVLSDIDYNDMISLLID